MLNYSIENTDYYQRYKELTDLLEMIKKFENAMEEELHNENSRYVYDKEEQVERINLKGKNYAQIEEIFKYIWEVNSLTGLKLRDRLREIKKYFLENMIRDIAFEKSPKSIALASLSTKIMDTVDYLYAKHEVQWGSKCLILSLDDLEKIKEKVTIDSLELGRKVSAVTKYQRSEEMKRRKASRDYIKRNKK